MSVEGLKIVIGADVNSAIQGTNKLNRSFRETEDAFADILKQTGSFDTALNRMVRNGGVSINFLEKQIKDFKQAFAASLDPQSTRALGDALVSLKKKQQDLISGGLGGGADIGNKLGAALGPLRTLANIIPGIGIGGLVAAFSNEIGDLISQIGNLHDATFNIREFNSAFAEGAGKSISGIELLKAKINDANTSQSQRLQLVKDYNKEADNGNKIDLTQINNLDAINSKIDQQINLLKQRAAVRAAEAIVAQKFEDLFNKQLELKIDFPNIESRQQDITSKAKSFIDNINAKLKITPEFDTKELLALSDLPVKQLAELAAKGDKFKIFSDPNAVKTLQRFNSELKSSIALTNNLGQAGVFEKLQGDVADAQKAVDDTLNAFSKILEVPGFSEKDTKEKIKKAFVGIKAGFVEGLNDIVQLIESKDTKLSLPFQLALDSEKLSIQFSNVKTELDEKLHQFDLKPSVIPIEVKLQIADAAKTVKPLTDEIRKQFADARGALFGLTSLDLSSVFNTDGVQDSLAGIFDKVNGIGGELSDIRQRGDFTLFAEQVQKASELLTSALQPAFQDLFTEVVNGQFKLTTFFDSLEKQLKQLTARLLANAAIAAILAGITGGNFFSIFKGLSGFRETGGPVNRAMTYVVNERGKEMFIPNVGMPQIIAGGPQLFTPEMSGKIMPAWMSKNFAMKMNIPGLEAGGLIKGPTLSLIGEGFGISSINPEVVAPLSTLTDILKSARNDVDITIQSKTRGSDLTHTITRQEKRKRDLS